MTGPALWTELQRSRPVYRIGHAPDPWRWTPWQYVKATGRWDDPTGTYRVLYVADSVYACLVEVLAQFRPDPSLDDLYDDLFGDPDDTTFPTVPAGTVDPRWIGDRMVGTARMTGRFVAIGHSQTLAWLRRRVPRLLLTHRITDLDGAAVRDAEPRAFTQALSALFYGWTDADGTGVDGIGFRSRWGDNLHLWSIYERTQTGVDQVSPLLSDPVQENLRPDNPDLARALILHHLVLGRAHPR